MVMSKSHYKECAMSTEMKTFEELKGEAGTAIGDTTIATFVARAMMRGASKNKVVDSITELFHCSPEMTKSVAAFAKMFRDYPEIASQWWSGNIGNHRLWGVGCATKIITLCLEHVSDAVSGGELYGYSAPKTQKVSEEFKLSVASENGIYELPLSSVWFQVNPSAIHPYVRFDQADPKEEAHLKLVSEKKRLFGKVEVYERVSNAHALVVVPSQEILDKLLAPIIEELDCSMDGKELFRSSKWPKYSHLIQINTTLA
jgi:hypothetical protein